MVIIKKIHILVVALILLVGCGGADKEYKEQLKESEKQLEEAEAETKRLEEVSDQIDETSDLIAELQEEMEIEDDSDDEGLEESEAIELLEYGALGEGDSLIDLVVKDNEIKVSIEIADDDIFDDKSLLAETVYSRAGDELLEYDGWEILTIEFIDIGDVSLHIDEKETNEYGMDYFPLEKIIEQLE